MPAHVLRTARAVAGSAPFYAFVSTTAVYQAWNTARLDESAATWPGRPDQDGDPADLGKLPVHKRGCELAVEQTYGPGACLSAFVLDQVEARAAGIHNVVPDGPNTTSGRAAPCTSRGWRS